MAKSSKRVPRDEYKYVMLICDKEVAYNTNSRTILNSSRSARQRLLRGTLLRLSPSKQPYSDGSWKIHVSSLDDDNMDLDCYRSDISPLNEPEKDLLIAVTSREERYKLYAFEKDTFAFGLVCNLDDWVLVKVRLEGDQVDVAGVIRYRGILPNERGIHFGVELEEYRGAGTTDGTFRNRQFFACQEDCGVFVPITKIKKRYRDYDRSVRYYRKNVLEVDSAFSPSDFHLNQRVHVFTDEMKEGRVIYCGRPTGASQDYVGIELDNSVEASMRSDGTYRSVTLFHPQKPEQTILCPKLSVFPVDTPDQPGILKQYSAEPMEISTDPFDFNQFPYGSQVSIDTQRDGTKSGHVIWVGKPHQDVEVHVGIELDFPCLRNDECNDGTFRGVGLFKPEHVDRTVLVPASCVMPYERSLSPETVKDSINATSASPMERLDMIPGPPPYHRHHSDSLTEDVAAGFERLAMTDVSDAIMSTSPSKPHSAPIIDKNPGAVRVKVHAKPSSTGNIPTSFKYGQTSALETGTRGTTRPKDSGSKTVALAESKQEKSNWTTKKFPQRNESHSRRNDAYHSSSSDVPIVHRKTAGVKSHRTTGQDHGRIVSKFTLLNDVLSNVALHIHGQWKTLAENLGIMNKEIADIVSSNSTSKECAMDMLRRWREQMSSSRDKLGPLIKACQKSDFNYLANELEQGLDEQRLHHIAGQVHETVWNVLGDSLGLERDHLSRLQMEDPHPSQRVYNMLLDWRLTLTFDTDKPLMLAKGLGDIGMDELAMEVCRGLTAEVLEDVARGAKEFWKRLAMELHLTTKEQKYLEKANDDLAAAYETISRWKRRQEPEGDLLSLLSDALRKCGRESLANKVVKGMDDTLLEVIANMVEDKQHSIANALSIPMQEQFGHNDSRHGTKPSTLRLLQWWRANRAMNEEDGQRKLFDVLMKYGYKDAADMVLPESFRPQVQPERIPPPRGLDDQNVLGTIANMKCSTRELAHKLQVPDTEVVRIQKHWHDVSKQKYFFLRNWINRNESIYLGNNLGWQLCKILLEMGMDHHADFLVDGSPSNRRWFEQTNFATYQENHEEEPTYPAAYDYPQHRRIGYDKDVIVVDRSPEARKSDLDVESVVEVKIRGESHYGVIKSLCTHLNWLDDDIAGIELEEPIIGGTDGSFEGTQYFTCGPRKAVFVYLSQCRPDSRFPTNADTYRVFTRETSLDFGNQESPIIPGYVELRKFQQSSVGENKGIQGDQNSCYLDVSLYSMFSFNTTFDVSLLRPKEGGDVHDFQEIQTILREKIVNPLREIGFVRADRVRDLRLHLDKLGLLPGMTNEEKDPEEFLHMLVRDVLKAQPLIKTRHGDTKEIDSQYLYQIFMEKNDSLELPKVEQLLHQSFLDNELKLVEIPDCLVVQMPRFGKDYKMYRRILPSLTIDITDLLENYPRSCTICGELAKVECRDCRPDEGISEEFIKSYCIGCCDMSHSSLPSHRIKQLTLNPEVEKGFELVTRTGQPLHFHRQMMELFAVVCIQTSHYVAFVKTETKPTHWVFFDSMADRDASTVPGFNIPKVTHLKNFEEWLKDPQRIINTPDDKKLPEHLRRLLGDAYICFYRKIGTEQTERTPKEWASGATNY
ncbi:uncharacterized protein LOC121407476 isoform X2 [Lytechinus variegatus]|uniref:uncharacterized protein LOC121407476 isoform X2 n=1 Tax=Lytechinus variegatus TaxID=7654 RepID=UPI001BB26A8E|nr:uncharacterized protein LOC121407476 isoform X2 [Lytechinus variegatus]